MNAHGIIGKRDRGGLSGSLRGVATITFDHRMRNYTIRSDRDALAHDRDALGRDMDVAWDMARKTLPVDDA